MKPAAYIRWLEGKIETAVKVSLMATAKDAAVAIRNNLPPNRTRTRRAVRYRITKQQNGYRAALRLRFSKRYRATGTKTERLFRRSWRTIQPRVVSTFRNKLGEQLKRI